MSRLRTCGRSRHPVEAIRAKFAEPLAAATGAIPGSNAAGAIARALNSCLVAVESFARSAVIFRNLALGAAALSDSNCSFGIGYRVV